MKRLIVIGGPTASGKTALASEMALHFQTEIISADSRQFYREMEIGNARPSPDELAAVPHHFIADRSVTEPLSAGRFAEEALHRLALLYKDKDIAVVVGGSGLYLRALCEGLNEFPPVLPEAEQRVTTLSATEGLKGLQVALQQEDPSYYAVVDRLNGRRLERALKVCYSGTAPYSSYLGKRPARPFQPIYLRPSADRETLYRHIDRRVDQMLTEGLKGEATRLFPLRELPSLQTVGYQEWWPYFRGEIDYGQVIELIKRNSRRYAKRQFTWFRDYTPVGNREAAVAEIANFNV